MLPTAPPPPPDAARKSRRARRTANRRARLNAAEEEVLRELLGEEELTHSLLPAEAPASSDAAWAEIADELEARAAAAEEDILSLLHPYSISTASATMPPKWVPSKHANADPDLVACLPPYRMPLNRNSKRQFQRRRNLGTAGPSRAGFLKPIPRLPSIADGEDPISQFTPSDGESAYGGDEEEEEELAYDVDEVKEEEEEEELAYDVDEVKEEEEEELEEVPGQLPLKRGPLPNCEFERKIPTRRGHLELVQRSRMISPPPPKSTQEQQMKAALRNFDELKRGAGKFVNAEEQQPLTGFGDVGVVEKHSIPQLTERNIGGREMPVKRKIFKPPGFQKIDSDLYTMSKQFRDQGLAAKKNKVYENVDSDEEIPRDDRMMKWEIPRPSKLPKTSLGKIDSNLASFKEAVKVKKETSGATKQRGMQAAKDNEDDIGDTAVTRNRTITTNPRVQSKRVSKESYGDARTSSDPLFTAKNTVAKDHTCLSSKSTLREEAITNFDRDGDTMMFTESDEMTEIDTQIFTRRVATNASSITHDTPYLTQPTIRVNLDNTTIPSMNTTTSSNLENTANMDSSDNRDDLPKRPAREGWRMRVEKEQAEIDAKRAEYQRIWNEQEKEVEEEEENETLSSEPSTPRNTNPEGTEFEVTPPHLCRGLPTEPEFPVGRRMIGLTPPPFGQGDPKLPEWEDELRELGCGSPIQIPDDPDEKDEMIWAYLQMRKDDRKKMLLLKRRDDAREKQYEHMRLTIERMENDIDEIRRGTSRRHVANLWPLAAPQETFLEKIDREEREKLIAEHAAAKAAAAKAKAKAVAAAKAKDAGAAAPKSVAGNKRKAPGK
ncbi:hypothetical protein FN846DRAFT_890986 [Sphaerosporella brunnea]|uniref:Uncharacterized protein n=1 Tax=Sphaerosporella brunnea TaxID=1250544 RepID=A0A5J5EVJ9_9PEZI|nr:hypothetical protein FN846DRAFT_890986 [Sphaerosporella brunnea]